MATAVLNIGHGTCVVRCSAAPIPPQQQRLSHAEQLSLVLTMLRRHDQREVVLRLLEQHFCQVPWRRLPSHQRTHHLMRLLLLARLQVQKLARLTGVELAVPTLFLSPRAQARPEEAGTREACPDTAPLFSTRLQLCYGEHKRPLLAPVVLQAGSLQHVTPVGSGPTIEVPGPLDLKGDATWQLQHLLQAARQGSLDTWGAGIGEAQAATPMGTTGG